MGNPEILILDEPTSGLDPNQVSEVRSLIKKIGETRTVIISTHILSEVEMLCSRVIIISKGRKVADSSTQELREHYGHSGLVRMAVDAPSETQLKQKLMMISGVDSCTVGEDSEGFLLATVGVKNDEEIRPRLARAIVESGWDLFSLDMQKNSLEDVFRALTTGGEDK